MTFDKALAVRRSRKSQPDAARRVLHAAAPNGARCPTAARRHFSVGYSPTLLRLAQYDRFRDAAASLQFARAVVSAKIANGRAVLARFGTRAGTLTAMASVLDGLDKASRNAGEVTELDTLLGIEGGAAASYFPALMQFNRGQWIWSGRKRHPSPDPLNAMLSLTYVMLTHELASLLEGLGADPGLGFLHQPDAGRPSLALDLLEPFRHPVADRLVLTLANRATFSDTDFVIADGVCSFTPESLRRFFELYERWMLHGGTGGFRPVMRRECEKLIRWLRTGGEWAGWQWQEESASGEGVVSDTSSVTI